MSNIKKSPVQAEFESAFANLRRKEEKSEHTISDIEDMINILADMPMSAFIPIDNGFSYTISVAPDKMPIKTEKEGYIEKDKKQTKWQFEVLLHDFKIHNKSYAEILETENEKKYDKIIKLQLGDVYILELGKQGTVALAKAIREYGYVKFIMYRTGSKFKTMYHFEVVQ